MHDQLNPPLYCPDALASDVGWINPRNGELLVSIRNLRQKIAERDLAIQRKKEKLVVQQEAPKVEDERQDTQKALDVLTDQLTSVIIEEHNITLTVKDDANVVEEVKKPGRPKKVKESDNV